MSGCTVFSNNNELARHAAVQWLQRLAKRDAGQPFTVALSGGRIPRLLYESVVELAEPSAFDNVHFFWGDERVVPPTDDESNFKLADLGLFRPLQIPPSQVHRVQTERSETEAGQPAPAQVPRFTHSPTGGAPGIGPVFLRLGGGGHVGSPLPRGPEGIGAGGG